MPEFETLPVPAGLPQNGLLPGPPETKICPEVPGLSPNQPVLLRYRICPCAGVTIIPSTMAFMDVGMTGPVPKVALPNTEALLIGLSANWLLPFTWNIAGSMFNPTFITLPTTLPLIGAVGLIAVVPPVPVS